MTRDLDVLILNSSGSQIASGRLGGTSSENVNVNLVSGRDYFIKVFPFGRGPASNYSLQINAPHNNTMANATSLGTVRTSVSQNGSVGGIDPVDVYRFRVGSSGSTRIQLSGLSRDVDVFVLDSTGRTVASGTRGGNSSEDFRVNLSAGRDYFIRVVPFGSSAAASSYRLTLSR